MLIMDENPRETGRARKREGLELVLIATPATDSAGNGRGRCPPENPLIETGPDDIVLEPRADEPGVEPDGTASPLENPVRRWATTPPPPNESEQPFRGSTGRVASWHGERPGS